MTFRSQSDLEKGAPLMQQTEFSKLRDGYCSHLVATRPDNAAHSRGKTQCFGMWLLKHDSSTSRDCVLRSVHFDLFPSAPSELNPEPRDDDTLTK
jgi:hypothetical protein